MAIDRQTARDRQNAQDSSALVGLDPVRAGNILPEIAISQNEPRTHALTPYIATLDASKISTEPTGPSISIPHHINNADATRYYYKFAKFKIVRHTILTAQASARGPRP